MLEINDVLGQIETHAEACGYTVRGLFTVAGVSYSNWHRWKKGEKSPTLATIHRLLAVKPLQQAATKEPVTTA